MMHISPSLAGALSAESRLLRFSLVREQPSSARTDTTVSTKTERTENEKTAEKADTGQQSVDTAHETGRRTQGILQTLHEKGEQVLYLVISKLTGQPIGIVERRAITHQPEKRLIAAQQLGQLLPQLQLMISTPSVTPQLSFGPILSATAAINKNIGLCGGLGQLQFDRPDLHQGILYLAQCPTCQPPMMLRGGQLTISGGYGSYSNNPMVGPMGYPGAYPPGTPGYPGYGYPPMQQPPQVPYGYPHLAGPMVGATPLSMAGLNQFRPANFRNLRGQLGNVFQGAQGQLADYRAQRGGYPGMSPLSQIGSNFPTQLNQADPYHQHLAAQGYHPAYDAAAQQQAYDYGGYPSGYPQYPGYGYGGYGQNPNYYNRFAQSQTAGRYPYQPPAYGYAQGYRYPGTFGGFNKMV